MIKRILVSFAYLRDSKPLLNRLLKFSNNYPNTEIMIDCGAFTSHRNNIKISAEEYSDFLKSYKNIFNVNASLDVIGDPDRTVKNYLKLINLDTNVCPVFTRGCIKKHLEIFKNNMKKNQRIFIGGISRDVCSKEQIVAYLSEILIWLKEFNITFWHAFGLEDLKFLRAFKPPSCDATHFVIGGIRFGKICVLGRGFRPVSIYKTDFVNNKMSSEIRSAINQICSQEEIYQLKRNPKSYIGNHSLVGNVSARSGVLYQKFLKENFNVDLFLACATIQSLDRVEAAYTWFEKGNKNG